MAVQTGDILLDENFEIFGTNDGDLATGDGHTQHVAAIVSSTTGSFVRKPTLGANLNYKIDGVADSRKIARHIGEALAIDGTELREMDIRSDSDEYTVDIISAVKITDNTDSLI